MGTEIATAAIGQHNYANVLDGTVGLLGEVTTIVDGLGAQYIVMGGWCPYLRNKREDVRHPGTKDVDLLFARGDVRAALSPVIGVLIQAGYYVSAKHPFQLLRGLRVCEKTVWFNVDLMHPAERSDKAEFVDHFELDIPQSSILDGVQRTKSIGIPTSRCLFNGSFDLTDVSGILPSGEPFRKTIPLLSAGGLVLSKCESMRSPKRARDAFDVYLMLMEPMQQGCLAEIQRLCGHYPDLKAVFATATKRLRDPKGAAIFDENVRQYWKACDVTSPAQRISELLAQIA